MSIRKILSLVALGAILGGCTTLTPQERRAADEKTCLSYGFRRGTDALATCLQRIDLDRRAESRSLRYDNDPMLWGWSRPVIVR
jgi:hypothetical protein